MPNKTLIYIIWIMVAIFAVLDIFLVFGVDMAIAIHDWILT